MAVMFIFQFFPQKHEFLFYLHSKSTSFTFYFWPHRYNLFLAVSITKKFHFPRSLFSCLYQHENNTPQYAQQIYCGGIVVFIHQIVLSIPLMYLLTLFEC